MSIDFTSILYLFLLDIIRDAVIWPNKKRIKNNIVYI